MKGGAVIETVKQLYDSKDSDGYSIYNDQDDTGHQLASHAHAKGFTLFNSKGGFWVIHSLPKWPNRISKGYDGLSDDTYGQTFMCLTLGLDTFDTVGKILGTNWVQTYDSNLPDKLASKLPNFGSYVDGDHSGEIQFHTNIQTAGGQTFTAFSKDKTWGGDLYDGFVAPTMKSDLIAETWQNGVGSMPSNCSISYSVKNIANLTTPEGDEWTIHQDHSKWALSQDGSPHFACVGDINRQYSQENRGGGTYCISVRDVWDSFNHLVTGVEQC
eukprot:CAMPEP_0175088982 /NCGR_PEP_ID=MMETSP0086_2-20121207/545_1 /TAXON_ID=136419 /ORGANISM="Unknown Unknown, Strain D1" /LENGTH=270 /DNA_ID=CAMNT_0016361465 /DNA_START=229 /DNA_END=1041 /DNA_ORIENTATION=-